MRRLPLVLALLTVWIGALPHVSLAASLERLSGGVDVQGAQWTGAPSASSFLPGAYLSYSLTSGFSAAATLQRDFPRQTTIAKAGLRFKIMDTSRGQIGLGANLVGYGDRREWLVVQEATSWESTVNGSYDLALDSRGRVRLAGIAGASWDQPNDIKCVRIGLRYQVFGGLPL